MEKAGGSSHNNNTIIPSIILHLLSLQLVFGLIYNISTFFLSYTSLFHLLGISVLEVKNEAKKTIIIDEGNKKQLMSDDNYCSLSGRDIDIVMEKLGIEGGLEGGGGEVEQRWGCSEICGMFEEEQPSLEEVKEAFGVFDVNGDGFIDARELQRLLCVMGLTQGNELKACNMMISVFDQNNDGMIDFTEFLTLIFKFF